MQYTASPTLGFIGQTEIANMMNQAALDLNVTIVKSIEEVVGVVAQKAM